MLKSNELLSIVIPTYNRAKFLNRNLEIHIPILKKYNIEIFISDNASDDETENLVKNWIEKYSLINYYKNEINIGPDANFEKALKMANSKYIWLLGDTYYFDEFEIDLLLDRITNKDYEAVIVNSGDRVKTIENCIFKDHNELLVSIGWHMTQLSSLIFSKELLLSANFSRYYNSNFIQTGIIFEFLSYKKEIEVLWNRDISIKLIKLDNTKKISWQKETFKIWLRNWPNFIFSLPPIYSLDSKQLTIKKHNILTKLFNLKFLFYLRSYGFYTLNDYFIYKKL